MPDFNLLIYIGLFFLISQIFGKISYWLRAPHLIGYLVSGILFGPYMLQIFSSEMVEEMNLFTEMALALIAFSIGSSLKLPRIKGLKKLIIRITLLQAIVSMILVGGIIFLSLYFYYPYESVYGILSVSILLAVISIATAPSTIISLVHEYKAQGRFTNILLGVTALSDIVTLFLYSFVVAISLALVSDAEFNLASGIINPFLNVIYAIALGVFAGIIIRYMIRYFREDEILLGLLLGSLFIISGIAFIFGFSHLLPIMIFAFFVENYSGRSLPKKFQKSINSIEKPILGVFFLLAGAHLDISRAFSFGALVALVFFARLLGKLGGTMLAVRFPRSNNQIKSYTGLALLPSAGFAIGLILEAQSRLQEYIPEMASLMLSVVLGKTLINELISPFLVKFVLKKSGELSGQE
jgi:Kef-type K+ transport system membrane component KefB